MSEPTAPPAEDKDWTYVVTAGCEECGFEPYPHSLTADRVRATIPRWQGALAASNVATRPSPLVWSPLEYGCHVRDVCGVMAGRARLMLADDGASFENWDQDQAAVVARYWAQDAATVSVEYAAAATGAAAVFGAVQDEEWVRRGLRSNGSEFTLASLGLYFVHDLEHHLHDVGA